MSSLCLVIWLILSIISMYVHASEDEYNDSSPTCELPTTFQHLNNTETVTFKSCPGCIVKCCPAKHMLLIQEITTDDDQLSTNSTCVENEVLKKKYKITEPSDYSKAKIDIYSNKDFKNKPINTGKSLSDFIFIFSEKFLDQDCSINLIEYYAPEDNTYYLLEDGSLSIYTPNEPQPWSDYTSNGICVDYQVTMNLKGEVTSSVPSVNFRAMIVSIEDARTNYSVYAMMISCFFLTLTLCVYAKLRQLRNLQGKVLMAVVTSLLATFLCKIVMDFAYTNATTCSYLSLLLIYAALSLFAWMNVFSYSVMRTFTLAIGYKLTPRQENVKFLRYSLFAFGLPLTEIVFIVVVDHLDLTHLPRFIKPHIFNSISKQCFLEYNERRLYFNIPIAIAIVTNTLMFVRTVYAYFKQKRSINRNMPSASMKSQQDKDNSFLLVLKLSVMMGVMWVFEVISTEVAVGSPAWVVADVYNTLSGLATFILFVCTKRVLGMLSKKYPVFRPLARKCGLQGFSDESSRNDTETTVSNSQSSTRHLPVRLSVKAEMGDDDKTSATPDVRHSRPPPHWRGGHGQVCSDIYFKDYKKEPLPVHFVTPA